MSKILDIVNFNKSFTVNGSKFDVLKNINITIDRGDIFGIMGLSGVGKSTLVRCINGLEKSGQEMIRFYQGDRIIVLNGLSDKDMTVYRRKIAMIFQNFNLFKQRSVLSNVMYPMNIARPRQSKDKIKERALELLKLVGLKDKASSYPSQLSGGQQQRVAIARALASDPEILLCDECTSALDPTTANQILDLLKSLNEKMGLTIMIIAHQMSVIERVCNKVAILADHRVVEQGEMSDVFLNPKSAEAKELIYSRHITTKLHESELIKLIFEGNPESPIITNIVQDCNILVSIVYANSWVTDGKVYGQIIIRLPFYEEDIKKLKAYLDLKGVKYEEVIGNDSEDNS